MYEGGLVLVWPDKYAIGTKKKKTHGVSNYFSKFLDPSREDEILRASHEVTCNHSAPYWSLVVNSVWLHLYQSKIFIFVAPVSVC